MTHVVRTALTPNPVFLPLWVTFKLQGHATELSGSKGPPIRSRERIRFSCLLPWQVSACPWWCIHRWSATHWTSRCAVVAQIRGASREFPWSGTKGNVFLRLLSRPKRLARKDRGRNGTQQKRILCVCVFVPCKQFWQQRVPICRARRPSWTKSCGEMKKSMTF